MGREGHSDGSQRIYDRAIARVGLKLLLGEKARRAGDDPICSIISFFFGERKWGAQRARGREGNSAGSQRGSIDGPHKFGRAMPRRGERFTDSGLHKSSTLMAGARTYGVRGIPEDARSWAEWAKDAVWGGGFPLCSVFFSLRGLGLVAHATTDAFPSEWTFLVQASLFGSTASRYRSHDPHTPR